MKTEPSPRAALVVSVTRFNDTAAPTPVPVEPAVATADDVVADVALTVASADGEENEPVRCAAVQTFSTVIANDPATPTDAAAPEIASLVVPAPPVVASRSSDEPDAVPSTDALFATSARVIATPAPTAAVPPVDDPSPFEPAATVSDDVTVSAPPAEIVTPAGRIAWANGRTTVTATAAATETGPLDVVVVGVVGPPAPEPPAASEVPPAKLRWSATWPSTPPLGEPDVPVDDAVAVSLVVEVPAAVMLAAPPTVSDRIAVAVTV